MLGQQLLQKINSAKTRHLNVHGDHIRLYGWNLCPRLKSTGRKTHHLQIAALLQIVDQHLPEKDRVIHHEHSYFFNHRSSKPF